MLQVNIFFLCQTLCWSVCATLNLLLRWINQKKDEKGGGMKVNTQESHVPDDLILVHSALNLRGWQRKK